MNRIHQVILFIVVAIILFIVPFVFSEQINEKIGIGINLIAGLTSLLTFAIAILIFNKFGIERSLLDKQTTEVFDLLENLNKSTVLIRGNNEFLRFNPAKPYNKFYEKFYHRKLLFSVKYVEGLQNIWNYSENVFVPKDIAVRLRKIQVFGITEFKGEIDDNYLIVSSLFKSDDEEFYGQAFQKEMTFMDFISEWNEVIEEVKKWISNNSSVNSELNLN